MLVSLALCWLVSCLVSQARGLSCGNPYGEEGVTRKEGCLRETCKAGVWRHSLDHTVCCYDRRPHEVDTVITSSTSTDGCTVTEVACTKDAKTILHTRNSCPRLATFEQVEEIKTLIEIHLDQHQPEQTTAPPDTEEKGILITGGNASSLVELYLPGKQKICRLPSTSREFNQERLIEVVEGNPVVCGLLFGDFYLDFKCLELLPDQSKWAPHGQTVRRSDYSIVFRSWVSPKGLMLVGEASSQLVMEKDTNGFAYGVWKFCAIPDGDSVILTGGLNKLAEVGNLQRSVPRQRSVTRHNLKDDYTFLPSLNHGRQNHGCGSYKEKKGSKVLLVFGGQTDYHEAMLTVEKYYVDPVVPHLDHWLIVEKAALKSPLPFVTSASLGNKIYFMGFEGYADHNQQLRAYDGESESWEVVAELETSRDKFVAITAGSATKLLQYCD